MRCPACPDDLNSPLEEITYNGIRIDYCPNCGGLWFDNYELEKFDEAHEPATPLLEIRPGRPDVEIDHGPRRPSPRHPDLIMQRLNFSYKGQVEIDVCPQSGGIWLDYGELERIRRLYPHAEDKQAAADALAQEVCDKTTATERAETDEFVNRSRRFANFFRFITPSAYIPGKQDGGAF